MLGAYWLTAFALSMLLSRHGALPLLLPSWLVHGYAVFTGWFIYYLEKGSCPQLNGELDWEQQYVRDSTFTFFSYWDAETKWRYGFSFREQLEVLRDLKYKRDNESSDSDNFLCIGSLWNCCCSSGICACCRKTALMLYAPAVFLVDAQWHSGVEGSVNEKLDEKGCCGPAGGSLLGEIQRVAPSNTLGGEKKTN